MPHWLIGQALITIVIDGQIIDLFVGKVTLKVQWSDSFNIMIICILPAEFIYRFHIIHSAAIISGNNVNRLIFIVDTQCFLWGMTWNFKYYLNEFQTLNSELHFHLIIRVVYDINLTVRRYNCPEVDRNRISVFSWSCRGKPKGPQLGYPLNQRRYNLVFLNASLDRYVLHERRRRNRRRKKKK